MQEKILSTKNPLKQVMNYFRRKTSPNYEYNFSDKITRIVGGIFLNTIDTPLQRVTENLIQKDTHIQDSTQEIYSGFIELVNGLMKNSKKEKTSDPNGTGKRNYYP